MVKILILTPVIQPGGNLATMNRIRKHLEESGYECDLKSSADFTGHKDLESHLLTDNVSVILAIHALKTGAMVKECPVPYILILGGSDVYVCAKDPTKLSIMSDAVRKARFIVSFSSDFKNSARRLWPWLEDWKMKVIPQAVETCVPKHSRIGHPWYPKSSVLIGHEKTKKQWHSEEPEQFVAFILIAGIRPVKDPLFLVSTFQEWHEQDGRVLYLIVGHKLDVVYAENVVEPEICKKPGVLFIPGVTSADAHLFMRNSFAAVNSSINEGMSLAILEAMQLQVPVLARKNVGNVAIVDDGQTGLLFDSEEVFLTQAKRLIQERSLRHHLIQNASKYIDTHHSVREEKGAYINIIQQCLSPTIGDL